MTKGDDRIKQKLQTALAAVLCCFTLSGCAIFTKDTAELLKPPALTEELSEIADAISQSAGEDYTLTYPARGRFRTPVVQDDIDGDGVKEALAFYSKTEAEETTEYVDLFCASGEKWQSAARQGIVAGGVDQVDLSDLDGDGVKEIIVGWEIYGTSEMQLAVYTFSGNKLNEEMLEQYTRFACCELNEDAKGDILLIRLNPAEESNTAFWYAWDTESKGIKEISSCPLDASVKSINDPVVATLSSGKTAVYLDEVKGVGAVTEVLFSEKNSLVNPLLNRETGETSSTLRSATFSVQDINADGFVEIPVQKSVPSVLESETNEKLYLTDWCSFDGETLTTQLTAMMNTLDEYYYILPSGLADQVAVLKDTDRHLRELYRYDAAAGRISDLLVSFVAVPAGGDTEEYLQKGYKKLSSDKVWTYLCKVGEETENGLSFGDIKAGFRTVA